MKTLQPPRLDEETRALIDAARGTHEPNELDRARVRRAVELKLAAGAPLPLAASSGSLSGATKALLVAAGLACAVGAAAYARGRSVPAAPTLQTAAALQQADAPARARALPLAPTAQAVVSAPPTALAPAPEPSSEPASGARSRPTARRPRPTPEPVAAPSASASSRADALAEEVRLLGSVNRALARHDLAAAHAALDEYDRKPTSGILAQERAVAGILLACADGRTEQARALASRFRARSPRSPLAARVDSSCAGASRTQGTDP